VSRAWWPMGRPGQWSRDIQLDQLARLTGLAVRSHSQAMWANQDYEVTIAHYKTYWFSESIQSKVLSEASTILKVMALQST
jgi:hypothetical protein